MTSGITISPENFIDITIDQVAIANVGVGKIRFTPTSSPLIYHSKETFTDQTIATLAAQSLQMGNNTSGDWKASVEPVSSKTDGNIQHTRSIYKIVLQYGSTQKKSICSSSYLYPSDTVYDEKGDCLGHYMIESVTGMYVAFVYETAAQAKKREEKLGTQVQQKSKNGNRPTQVLTAKRTNNLVDASRSRINEKILPAALGTSLLFIGRRLFDWQLTWKMTALITLSSALYCAASKPLQSAHLIYRIFIEE